MVEMAAAAYQHRKGSARALTPGELDAKSDLFLSPAKSAAGDFIPAFKGNSSSRRLPLTDAFNSEAAQLQDAELDLRSHKFDRVFGNGLFEDSAGGPGGHGTKPAPGPAKMNNLFEDPNRSGNASAAFNRSGGGPISSSTASMAAERDGTPDRGQGLLASRRHNSSVMRTPGTPAADSVAGSTAVEAFDADDGGMPVVARARVAAPVTQPRDRSVSAWEGQLKQLIAAGRREEAVRLPAPSSGLVRCYVKRVKNFFGTHCSFQMHLDNGDVFLLAARRRKKSKVSSYVVSLDLEDLRRDTDNCLSKVKANFVGTEYVLWTRGEDRDMKKGFGREAMCINFKQTALTTKGGPRGMFVILPLPELEWTGGEAGSQDSLSNSLELAKRRELPPYLEKRVAMLGTKPPEWDESLKAFTLDFHGRVKEASVKNFQLVHWDHNTDRRGADLMLQFGKAGDELYALDFAYPLTVEAAFAIALASIDTKLCYTI